MTHDPAWNPPPGDLPDHARIVSTQDVEARHRLAYWSDLVCAHLVKAQCDAPDGPEAFHGHILQHELGPMSLSRIQGSAQTVVRTPRLVAQTTEEQILINIQRTGCSVVRQGGREAVLQPGDAAIYSSIRPYELAFDGDFSQTVLIAPAGLVRSLMPGVDAVLASTLSGPQLSSGLVLRSADAIQSTQDNDCPEAIRVAADGLLRMVALGVNRLAQPLPRTPLVLRPSWAFDPAEALNALDQGVLVLDRLGNVVYSNQRARAVLADESGLRQSGSRLDVQGCTPRQLMMLIERVLSSGAAESLPVQCDQGSMLHGLSFRALKAANQSLGEAMGLVPADHVLVVFASPGRQRQISPRQMMQWFGLTPAEARLAHALLKGHTLEQVQQDQGVKLTTLRTQLRSVLRKTGTERQQDLIRLLAQLPSLR
jgi:DNA-binding CsgD family transcriptional regulator